MSFEEFLRHTIWILLAVSSGALTKGKLRNNLQITRTSLSVTSVSIFVLLFCLTSMLLNILISGIELGAHNHQVSENPIGPSSSIYDQLGFLILIGIGSSLGEELFFRGWLLKFLLRWSSVPIAILVTSLAFGMSHGSLSQAIPAGILGIYLGALTHHAKSIRPAVTAHIANNTLLLLWATPTISVAPIWLTTWMVLIMLLIRWSCANTRNPK